MNPIRQLDYALINKIAAGEVVERPVSVVKELTENAIDAGASAITVEIKEGGLTLIRVTDNGCGIPAEQVPLAFAQHATSKIIEADDLYALATLGFRGEALSSIAAVAQVEMITKTAGAITGFRYAVQGGQETARQAVGCVDGTTLVVAHLFYNTPARRKFLKKPATEASYIADMVQKMALGYPGIAFRYIHNGQLVWQTNGSGDLKTTIFYVYGKDMARKLITVRTTDTVLSLDGYIGTPDIARSNRSYAHFFVNGRYIKSELLQAAAEAAYKPVLMSGKFPVLVLPVTISPSAVDVNVHPAKTQVRFSDEDTVYRQMYEAIREALSEQVLIPDIQLEKDIRAAVKKAAVPEAYQAGEQISLRTTPPVIRPIAADKPKDASSGLSLRESTPVRGETGRTENPFDGQPVHTGKTLAPLSDYDTKTTRRLPRSDESAFDPADDLPLVSVNHKDSLHTEGAVEETPAQTASVREPFFKDYRIIGQAFQTYWIVQQAEALYLIDQHAAHERILYENLLAAIAKGPVAAQPLLRPLVLRLTPREQQILSDNLDLLERMGFETEDFGYQQTALRTVPFMFKGPANAELFTAILDTLAQQRTGLDAYKLQAAAMMACKAAVKANDTLTPTEAQAMIQQMLALENPFTCPHGRPTIVTLSRHELEKMFKRVQ